MLFGVTNAAIADLIGPEYPAPGGNDWSSDGPYINIPVKGPGGALYVL